MNAAARTVEETDWVQIVAWQSGRLTEREREASGGGTTHDNATAMHLSPSTCATTPPGAFDNLGALNRTEANRAFTEGQRSRADAAVETHGDEQGVYRTNGVSGLTAQMGRKGHDGRHTGGRELIDI